mgnify:CR=1 FL=1
MPTGNEIRQIFLDYFKEKGHEVVPSASLIPTNDPTLMFVAAGMVPFKNVFLGEEKRPYTKATSSQRCVRAGGKHNDLENVGYTARHHTFFEMLGNFSFGDYFKKEAIPMAWELLTKHLNLPPEKLIVTVYHTDTEAYDIWHKDVGLSKEKIIKIDTSDNFWTMGNDGPCGPCTEIFYDHGPEVAGGPPGSADEDGDRFVEIWNVVFMQSLMQDGEIVSELKQKGVDTGAGLERLTAVCQGVKSNYDIDTFQAIINKAADLTGHTYGESREHDVSLRVLADHLRAMSFIIVDGVMPSNEGRGYVLRRIMRRAMRHGNLLGQEKPFIYNVVGTLCHVMGEAYPELRRAQKMVEETIKIEEERFLRTLAQGLKLLEEATQGMGDGDTLDGETAFKLYDTYGFPLDLTLDALRGKGISVDGDGFDKAMAAQRARARKANLGTGQEKLAPVWFDVRENQEPTEFLGYSATAADAVITALVRDNKQTTAASEGEDTIVVFNQTPFYGEAGGQVGDTGHLKTATGEAEIVDTQKLFDGHLVQHAAKVLKGEIKQGQQATLTVDNSLRDQTRRNHSAAHLFHAALRDVLGEHVFQKGSLVNAQKMRFDFSHNKALTAEEIRKIEDMVNHMVLQNSEVTTKVMSHEDATKAGALALFGEKYGDEVRVLTMGKDRKGQPFSVELCGGTHVARTGDIGLFKIVGESSVSAGVRRVEALTGTHALGYVNNREEVLANAAARLKASPDELPTRIEALQEDIKKLKKEVKQAQQAGGGEENHAKTLLEQAEDINGASFVGAIVPNIAGNALRALVDDLKNQLGSGVIVLGTESEGKATLCAGVTKDLTEKFNAGKIVNTAAEKVGGKGGGRPDLAMAGGKDPENLADAIKAARASLS